MLCFCIMSLKERMALKTSQVIYPNQLMASSRSVWSTSSRDGKKGSSSIVGKCSSMIVMYYISQVKTEGLGLRILPCAPANHHAPFPYQEKGSCYQRHCE